MSQIYSISPQCTDDTLVLLEFIKNVFDTRGIVYWLDQGILLKAIRDGHLVTSDLDISIWSSQIDQLLEACDELRANGFKIRFQNGLPFFDGFLQIYLPDHYKTPYNQIDIECYVQMDEEAVIRHIHRPMTSTGHTLFNLYRTLINRGDIAYSLKNRLFGLLPKFVQNNIAQVLLNIHMRTSQGLWYVLPMQHLRTFDILNVASMSFCIPSDVKNYLAYRYGPNWHIRDPQWRFASGKFLRIRPYHKFPRQHTLQWGLQSDTLSSQYAAHTDGRNLFQFTKDEINKMRSLDHP